MSNHSPPVNHRRSSLPKPRHAAASTSQRHLTPLLLLFLLLLLLRPAAAQNDTAVGPPDHSPNQPYPYGQRFNPSMAVIMVVLVSAFFLMGFVSVYVRQCAASRFRGGPGDDFEGTFLFGRGSIRRAPPGIDASVIQSFPTFQYSSVKGLKIGKGSLECAVCLNEFEDDDVLRLLPRCNHVFHTQCIDAWLSSHDTCPVCRANLTPKPGEKFDQLILHVAEPQPGSETTGLPDHVCIHVDDGRNINSESPSWQPEDCSSTNKSRPPPRSRSTGMRFTRLFPFPRSHSTGHSLVQPAEDRERFTLRLPEDVRDQIIKSASLNRARSCAADLPRARSERTGYRRSGSIGGRSIRGRNYFNYERFDQEDRTGRWGFSMTPPFIGRTGSVRSPAAPGGDDVGMPPRSNMSRPEKLPPFDRVFVGLDGDEGERPSNRLRPPHG